VTPPKVNSARVPGKVISQRAQVIFSDAHLAKWPAPDDDDGHPKVIR
jgi:hypothetical protein